VCGAGITQNACNQKWQVNWLELNDLQQVNQNICHISAIERDFLCKIWQLLKCITISKVYFYYLKLIFRNFMLKSLQKYTFATSPAPGKNVWKTRREMYKYQTIFSAVSCSWMWLNVGEGSPKEQRWLNQCSTINVINVTNIVNFYIFPLNFVFEVCNPI
jgi:hypothetical protein